MPGIVYKISGDNSQFQKDVNESQNIAQGGFNKISALGIAAWAAIGAAVIKATKAGVDFLKDSINTGMTFDKSMSQVAATMGTTVDKIEDLRNFAMEMGASTAFSAQQAADGLNVLAMSGLNAKEQMEALPDVLNLAASGNLDLATSAKYVTGAVKGFKDSFSNAGKYTDIISVGAAKANTNVNELGLALSGAAASASSYGQDVEGTTVALLRLAEQNVTGAEAATALNRAMMDLYTPTSGAEKAMKALGVSAYDSAGKARPLNDVVDELNKSMDGLSDAEKNQYKNAIFSTFGLQAFNKMTVSTKEKVNEFKTALNESTGAAKEMADTQLDNLAGDITLAQSAAEGLKISISNGLTPVLREFVKKGTTELGKLKAAFDEGGFKGLGRQFGDSLAEMVKLIGQKVPEITSAAVEFGKTFIGNIVDTIIKSKDKITNGLKTAFSNASQSIKGILKKIPEIAEVAFEFGKEFVLNLAASISDNVHNIVGSASDILSKIGAVLQDGIPKLGKTLVEILVQAILDFPSLLRGIGEVVFGTISGIIEAIPQAIAGIFSGGSKWVNKINEEIDSLFVDAREAAKTRTAEISEDVKQLGEEVGSMFEKSKKALEDIPSVMKDVDTSFAYAQHWVEVIEDLGGKTDLTKEEQAKLKLAIDELNKILPETDRIVQNENGTWQINIDKIKESIETLKERTRVEALLEYAKKLEVDLIEAQQKRADILSKINDKLEEQDRLQEGIKKYTSIYNSLQTSLTGVYSKMSRGVTEAKAVKDAWDKMPQPVKDFAEEVGITSVSTVSDLENIYKKAEEVLGADPFKGDYGLRGALKQADADVNTLYDSLDKTEDSISNYKTTLSQVYDAAAEQTAKVNGLEFDGVVDNAEKASNEIVEVIEDTGDKGAKKAKEGGEKTGDGYNEGLLSKKGDTERAAKEVTSGAVEGFEEGSADADIKKAGAESTQNYADGLLSELQAAKRAGGDISRLTAAEFALYQAFYNHGGNDMKGFIDGIKGYEEEAVEVARSISSKVLGKFSKVFNENSPSKEMYKIGAFVTEGLALGIGDTEEVRNVEKQSKKAAEASINTIMAAVDTSINASPVVIGGGTDMSEVVTLLKQYLPDIGAPIVLDTGELVGHTISSTDAELGELQRRRARYE